MTSPSGVSIAILSNFCNGFEITFVLEKHMVEDDVLYYKSSGGKIGNPSGGHEVLPFHMGRMWFRLAVTSSNQFVPVVAHDK